MWRLGSGDENTQHDSPWDLSLDALTQQFQHPCGQFPEMPSGASEPHHPSSHYPTPSSIS